MAKRRRPRRSISRQQVVSTELEKLRISADAAIQLGQPLIVMAGLVAIVYFAAGKVTEFSFSMSISVVATLAGFGGVYYGLRERKHRKTVENELEKRDAAQAEDN